MVKIDNCFPMCYLVLRHNAHNILIVIPNPSIEAIIKAEH